MENGNTKYDSRNNCSAIIETSTNTLIIGCKNSTIPNSVTSIGNDAFHYCDGITSVTIPNSITSIGDRAFAECSLLEYVVIGNSVTLFGNEVFSGCRALESITVENGNTKYDSRNNCSAIIETSTNTLIIGCKNSTIPNSVTSIGEYAFFGCNGMTSVTIPNSVTSIGNYAFASCFNLWQIRSLITDISNVSMGSSVFENVSTYYCLLMVPVGTSNAYTNVTQWEDFENIVEMGDIDGNSEVNGIDLNILINIILGKDDAGNYAGRANVEGQYGIVDGNDLNALINIILGK